MGESLISRILACCHVLSSLAPPASDHPSARERADQGAFSLGPATVCPGVAYPRQRLGGARAARRCPARRFSHHTHVWGHWRLVKFSFTSYASTLVKGSKR